MNGSVCDYFRDVLHSKIEIISTFELYWEMLKRPIKIHYNKFSIDYEMHVIYTAIT